jgi:hypothetical protein
MSRGERFGSTPARSSAARGRAAMGAAIWQTPGGVVSEINRINDDVLMFSSEISKYVGAHDPASPDATPALIDNSSWLDYLAMGGGAAAHDALADRINHARTAAAKADVHPTTTDASRLPLASFYLATWVPFITRWVVFYENNKNWSSQVWWNHAPEAEQFVDQLNQIRAAAKKLGMQVRSPAPSTWGKSVLDPGRDPAGKLGNFWDDLTTGAKVAIFGGLGLVGLVAVTSIASNLRSGKDPAENYMALARRFR